MKTPFKLLGAVLLLGAMIPASAYAATDSSSAQTDPTAPKSQIILQKGGGWRMESLFHADLLKLLNLDAQTLKTRLAAGESLAQIAEEQGVSRDDLKNALIAAYNQELDKQKADFASRIDQFVDSTRAGAADGGFGEHRFAVFKLYSQDLLDLLGMTQTELKQALASGQTLEEIASAKGIDVQKIVDLEVQAIMQKADQLLKDGKITQEQYDRRKDEATKMAEKMISAAPGSGKVRMWNKPSQSSPDSSASSASASAS